MPRNSFNTNLMLGVPSIDQQHYELFRSFQHLLSTGINEEAVSDALSRLTIQIYDHFKTEEQLIDRLNLPEMMSLDHKLAHLQIIEDLTEIHLETMHGLGVPFEEIVNRVSGYVNHHIVEFDLELKPYIGELA